MDLRSVRSRDRYGELGPVRRPAGLGDVAPGGDLDGVRPVGIHDPGAAWPLRWREDGHGKLGPVRGPRHQPGSARWGRDHDLPGAVGTGGEELGAIRVDETAVLSRTALDGVARPP